MHWILRQHSFELIIILLVAVAIGVGRPSYDLDTQVRYQHVNHLRSTRDGPIGPSLLWPLAEKAKSRVIYGASEKAEQSFMITLLTAVFTARAAVAQGITTHEFLHS